MRLRWQKERWLSMLDQENAQDTKTNKATFTIQIKFQQNATWQGEIRWLEANQTQQFRSELEMLHLMMDAMTQSKLEKDALPCWQEQHLDS